MMTKKGTYRTRLTSGSHLERSPMPVGGCFGLFSSESLPEWALFYFITCVSSGYTIFWISWPVIDRVHRPENTICLPTRIRPLIVGYFCFSPAAGGLVSGFLVYTFAPEAEGHGTDAAIEAYHQKGGYIRGRVPIIKTITSAITLTTGGSGGQGRPHCPDWCWIRIVPGH